MVILENNDQITESDLRPWAIRCTLAQPCFRGFILEPMLRKMPVAIAD
jgi:hypothetical protein